ncbi:MAG TPA: hypothetical protein VGM09_02730 [Bradyrhizobium sp.]|jgi:hypothetical protein
MIEIFMATTAAAIACMAVIVIEAMKLSRIGDHLVRQEVKLNLILLATRRVGSAARPYSHKVVYTGPTARC